MGSGASNKRKTERRDWPSQMPESRVATMPTRPGKRSDDLRGERRLSQSRVASMSGLLISPTYWEKMEPLSSGNALPPIISAESSKKVNDRPTSPDREARRLPSRLGQLEIQAKKADAEARILAMARLGTSYAEHMARVMKLEKITGRKDSLFHLTPLLYPKDREEAKSMGMILNALETPYTAVTPTLEPSPVVETDVRTYRDSAASSLSPSYSSASFSSSSTASSNTTTTTSFSTNASLSHMRTLSPPTTKRAPFPGPPRSLSSLAHSHSASTSSSSASLSPAVSASTAFSLPSIATSSPSSSFQTSAALPLPSSSPQTSAPTISSPSIASSSFLPPLVADIDDVQILHKVGGGKFGEVWKGLAWKTMPVALKSVRSEGLQQLMTEARMLLSLKHPNIVLYLGLHQAKDGQYYIVTEYMEKGSLLDLLRNKDREPFSPVELLKIAKNVAHGMQYLEQKQIVHRDLSARNLLVDANNIVKVGDLGLSQTAGTKEKGKSIFPVKWSAPEVLKGSKFSSKSDSWSFGVVLWELYTNGTRPYADMSNEEVVKKVCEEDYRLPRPPSCPDAIHELMLTCWKREPHERPAFLDISLKLSDLISPLEKSPSLSSSPAPSSSDSAYDSTASANYQTGGFSEHYGGSQTYTVSSSFVDSASVSPVPSLTGSPSPSPSPSGSPYTHPDNSMATFHVS